MRVRYYLDDNKNISTRKVKGKKVYCSFTRNNFDPNQIAISVSDNKSNNIWLSINNINKLCKYIKYYKKYLYLEYCSGNIMKSESSINKRIKKDINPNIYLKTLSNIGCICCNKVTKKHKNNICLIIKDRYGDIIGVRGKCINDFIKCIKDVPDEVKSKEILNSI